MKGTAPTIVASRRGPFPLGQRLHLDIRVHDLSCREAALDRIHSVGGSDAALRGCGPRPPRHWKETGLDGRALVGNKVARFRGAATSRNWR